jgi:putative transposase
VLAKDQIKLAKAPKRKITRVKALNIVEHLQEITSNERDDFVQKVSLNLVRTSDSTTFEDLNVKGMTKNDLLERNIANVS